MYHLIEHNLEAIFCQALFVFDLFIILNFLQSWYGSHKLDGYIQFGLLKKSCTRGFPASSPSFMWVVPLNLLKNASLAICSSNFRHVSLWGSQSSLQGCLGASQRGTSKEGAKEVSKHVWNSWCFETLTCGDMYRRVSVSRSHKTGPEWRWHGEGTQVN